MNSFSRPISRHAATVGTSFAAQLPTVSPWYSVQSENWAREIASAVFDAQEFVFQQMHPRMTPERLSRRFS